MIQTKRRCYFLLAMIAPVLLAGCIPPDTGHTGPGRCVGNCAYWVLHEYPHDSEAFTQGLVIADGVLYEGTGINGRSTLRRVDLDSGAVTQQAKLDDAHFGEGIAVVEDRIFQLTWQSKVGFIYDRHTFAPLGEFHYPTEGWGLTYDGENLILSDGSDKLYFYSPADFTLQREVAVTEGGSPVRRLNELEYIKGEIWANVWQTNTIVRIAPDTGKVLERIDLSGLLSALERLRADVLNGIAYDAEQDRIFVTGKLWPKIFEIERAHP